MKVNGETREAIFLRRLKRFSALVGIEGKEEIAYLPNTGRIWQLLTPGQQVFLAGRHSPTRRTKWDLYLFPLAKTLVWADPRAANSLVFEALKEGYLPQFQGFGRIYKEVNFRGNRIDFLLMNDGQRYLLEAKSVTLVQKGRALFPDAPTQRGVRQLKALMEAKRKGYKSGIIFVIQREDADIFSPNKELDPQFSHTLWEAIEKGIEAYACGCEVEIGEILLGQRVTIALK
jgi:sugar fermentation stimulation protein A